MKLCETAFHRNATIVEEHLRSGSPCNRAQQVVRVAVRSPNLPGFVVLVCNFAVRKYEIKYDATIGSAGAV